MKSGAYLNIYTYNVFKVHTAFVCNGGWRVNFKRHSRELPFPKQVRKEGESGHITREKSISFMMNNVPAWLNIIMKVSNAVEVTRNVEDVENSFLL